MLVTSWTWKRVEMSFLDISETSRWKYPLDQWINGNLNKLLLCSSYSKEMHIARIESKPAVLHEFFPIPLLLTSICENSFSRNMANWSFKRVAQLLRSLRRRGTNGQELLASENRRWRPTLPLYHFLKSRLIVLDDRSAGKKNHLGWNSANFGLVRGAEQ